MFVRDGSEGEVWSTVLKVLPIISLLLFVIIRKISSTFGWYDWKIIFGLLFSIAGDALLNFDDLFPYGMVAFAIAQICYIAAFGLKPLKPLFSIIFYALGVASELFLCLQISLKNIFSCSVYSCFPQFGSCIENRVSCLCFPPDFNGVESGGSSLYNPSLLEYIMCFRGLYICCFRFSHCN